MYYFYPGGSHLRGRGALSILSKSKSLFAESCCLILLFYQKMAILAKNLSFAWLWFIRRFCSLAEVAKNENEIVKLK